MVRKLAAEALGTLLLVCTVVGSGIMAVNLAQGNDAVALLGNTIATGAILYVLITVFGPLSGAHFNPAVSLVFRLRGELGNNDFLAYVGAQLIGGLLGTALAHAMFELALFTPSVNIRAGHGQCRGWGRKQSQLVGDSRDPIQPQLDFNRML